MCPVHTIAEEEDEEYDDVGEELKAQILSRNEAEQENETTAEEGSDMGFLMVAYVHTCFLIHLFEKY